MTRVDTNISEQVWNELKAFEHSVNWDGNTYKGNTNKVKLALTPAMSTRTIYVKIGNWEGDDFEIRISDHNASLRRDSKEMDIRFEEFNIELIKQIYRSYNA
jgi:hypothetical protein